MKAKTVQIVWHSKEPVFCIDFHAAGFFATGGSDKDVKLWEVCEEENGSPGVKYVASLSGHSKTINCLRFSPAGEYLATGGDDGEVLLWSPAEPGARTTSFGSDGETAPWRQVACLRGHFKDVQDLCWAPDSTALISGSVENLCIIWDVVQRKGQVRLENHQHYVQGVAWDPLNEYVVSQSSDRTCKIYAARPPAAGKKGITGPMNAAVFAKELICQQTLSKRAFARASNAEEAGPEDAGQKPSKPKAQKHFLFHDEGLATFFRRLAWSPDGSFLVVPTGVFKADADGPNWNTTYVFARGHWSQPCLHLPSLSKPVVAVRFNPVFFTLRTEDKDSQPALPFQLPYRFVFAVATLDSVIIYDTQIPCPIVLLGGLHFAPITDLSWSADGRMLAISSHDGYCSLAVFQHGDLGEWLAPDLMPAGFHQPGHASPAAVSGPIQLTPPEPSSQPLTGPSQAITPHAHTHSVPAVAVAPLPAPESAPGAAESNPHQLLSHTTALASALVGCDSPNSSGQPQHSSAAKRPRRIHPTPMPSSSTLVKPLADSPIPVMPSFPTPPAAYNKQQSAAQQSAAATAAATPECKPSNLSDADSSGAQPGLDNSITSMTTITNATPVTIVATKMNVTPANVASAQPKSGPKRIQPMQVTSQVAKPSTVMAFNPAAPPATLPTAPAAQIQPLPATGSTHPITTQAHTSSAHSQPTKQLPNTSANTNTNTNTNTNATLTPNTMLAPATAATTAPALPPLATASVPVANPTSSSGPLTQRGPASEQAPNRGTALLQRHIIPVMLVGGTLSPAAPGPAAAAAAPASTTRSASGTGPRRVAPVPVSVPSGRSWCVQSGQQTGNASTEVTTTVQPESLATGSSLSQPAAPGCSAGSSAAAAGRSAATGVAGTAAAATGGGSAAAGAAGAPVSTVSSAPIHTGAKGASLAGKKGSHGDMRSLNTIAAKRPKIGGQGAGKMGMAAAGRQAVPERALRVAAGKPPPARMSIATLAARAGAAAAASAATAARPPAGAAAWNAGKSAAGPAGAAHPGPAGATAVANQASSGTQPPAVTSCAVHTALAGCSAQVHAMEWPEGPVSAGLASASKDASINASAHGSPRKQSMEVVAAPGGTAKCESIPMNNATRQTVHMTDRAPAPVPKRQRTGADSPPPDDEEGEGESEQPVKYPSKDEGDDEEDLGDDDSEDEDEEEDDEDEDEGDEDDGDEDEDRDDDGRDGDDEDENAEGGEVAHAKEEEEEEGCDEGESQVDEDGEVGSGREVSDGGVAAADGAEEGTQDEGAAGQGDGPALIAAAPSNGWPGVTPMPFQLRVSPSAPPCNHRLSPMPKANLEPKFAGESAAPSPNMPVQAA